MSGLDLDAVQARARRAREWATANQEPPHNPLQFVPLSVREHFDRDMPALLAEVERLRAELIESRRSWASSLEQIAEVADGLAWCDEGSLTELDEAIRGAKALAGVVPA